MSNPTIGDLVLGAFWIFVIGRWILRATLVAGSCMRTRGKIDRSALPM